MAGILKAPSATLNTFFIGVIILVNSYVNSHIFDVTKLIAAYSKDTQTTFSIPNGYTDASELYYSTDLPITEFLLYHFENITRIIDEKLKLSLGSHTPPKISIQFRLDKHVSYYVPKTPCEYENELSYKCIPMLAQEPEENVNFNSISRVASLILDLSSMPCSSNEVENYVVKVKFLTKLKSWLNPNFSSFIPTGIKYKTQQIGCWIIRHASREVDVDLVILNLSESPQTFPLSFGMFQSRMETSLRENLNFIGKAVPDLEKIFYHITLENPEEVLSWMSSESVLQKYQHFHHNCITKWSSTVNTTHLIIDPFITSNTTQTSSTPVLKEPTNIGKWVIAEPKMLGYGGLHVTSTLSQSFSTVGAAFDTIYSDKETWACVVLCWKQNQTEVAEKIEGCKCGDILSWNKVEKKIFIKVFTISTQFWYLLKFLNATHIGNVTLDTIVIIPDGSLAGWAYSLKLLKTLPPTFKISCQTLIGTLDAVRSFKEVSLHSDPYCEDLLTLENFSEQIWWVSISMEWMNNVGYEATFVAYAFLNLEYINEARLNAMRRDGRIKSIIFRVNLWSSSLYFDRWGRHERTGLYCDDSVLKTNQFIEAILNWAEVHNVKIIIHGEPNRSTYWWVKLKTPVGMIQRGETFHPVLRNFPKSLNSSLKIDPCLEKTTDVGYGIIFSRNFTAVSLSNIFNNATLSPEEFEVMMKFPLHKFQKLVIQLGRDGESVKSVVTSFPKIFNLGMERSRGNISSILIGIDLPPEKELEMNYLREITKLINFAEGNKLITLEGIHVKVEDGEMPSMEVFENLETALSSGTSGSESKLGIYTLNCVYLINNLLANSTLKFPPQISFVICEEPDVIASNNYIKDVEKMLDGHLVIRKTFKKILPKVKVHFQLLTVAPTQGINPQKNFLNFFADINQFAQEYKMSYMFPAFDSPHQGTSGWWRIGNVSDVTNSSVYFEKEAEYMNAKTWLPKSPIPTPESQKWTVIVISSLGACLLTAIAVAIVFGLRMRKKSNILTKAEVKEFLEGRKALEKEMGDNLTIIQDQIYECLKFNPAFSVSKEEIKLDTSNILGKGQFGTVFKATVRGECVAVKTPNPGFSKDSFKSMLFEVKVMCYIGQHVNVVKFFGAYVKEISKGIIFIATELCENGSLLAYLQQKQKNLRNSDENEIGMNTSVEISQNDKMELLQFSKEIASGMAFIASKYVVHGDLSTRNVLLDGDNTCKITDFGLARKLYKDNKYVKEGEEPLPWGWLAIESLKLMEFTTKSDVWSYGVTIWEIFSLGEVPYSGLNWSPEFVERINNGMRMTKPEFATEEIYSEMLSCWNSDSKERPSFEDMKGFFVSLINLEYVKLEIQ